VSGDALSEVANLVQFCGFGFVLGLVVTAAVRFFKL